MQEIPEERGSGARWIPGDTSEGILILGLPQQAFGGERLHLSPGEQAAGKRLPAMRAVAGHRGAGDGCCPDQGRWGIQEQGGAQPIASFSSQ